MKNSDIVKFVELVKSCLGNDADDYNAMTHALVVSMLDDFVNEVNNESICIIRPKCTRPAWSKGLCSTCYPVATRLVASGKTTWDGLVSMGLAREFESKVLGRKERKKIADAATKAIKATQPQVCVIHGCGGHPHSRGLCGKHYQNCQKKVLSGNTTWEQLASSGQCLVERPLSSPFRELFNKAVNGGS